MAICIFWKTKVKHSLVTKINSVFFSSVTFIMLYTQVIYSSHSSVKQWEGELGIGPFLSTALTYFTFSFLSNFFLSKELEHFFCRPIEFWKQSRKLQRQLRALETLAYGSTSSAALVLPHIQFSLFFVTRLYKCLLFLNCELTSTLTYLLNAFA